MNYRLVTGIYFTALGCASLAGNIVSAPLLGWSEHWSVDLSFLLTFWIARGLLRGDESMRLLVLAIAGVFLLGLVADLTGRIIGLDIDFELWKWLLALVVSGFPLLLLSKRAKAQFRQPNPDTVGNEGNRGGD